MEQYVDQIPDDLAAAFDWCLEHELTDGLPVVPPSRRLIEAMVERGRREAAEVLGRLAPSNQEFTVLDLAVNAVMAGCLPDYFPVVLAAAEAMLDPRFRAGEVQATSRPCGPMIIVNGPIAKRLGIEHFNHCFGSGFRANATIGRSLRLVLMNLGGGRPGRGDAAAFGWPGKISFCWAENEDPKLNPWEPLHVERDFSPEESAVTVAAVNGYYNCSGGRPSVAEAMRMFGFSMSNATDHLLWHGQPILVMGIEKAGMMRQAGITKGEAKRLLFEQAQAPASALSDEVLLELKKSRMDLNPSGMLSVADSAEDIILAVAGGWGPHSVFLPTLPSSQAVTKKIME